MAYFLNCHSIIPQFMVGAQFCVHSCSEIFISNKYPVYSPPLHARTPKRGTFAPHVPFIHAIQIVHKTALRLCVLSWTNLFSPKLLANGGGGGPFKSVKLNKEAVEVEEGGWMYMEVNCRWRKLRFGGSLPLPYFHHKAPYRWPNTTVYRPTD